jgi:ribonucleoside-diphosphate reductase alpha chain
VRNPRNGKAFVIPRDVDIWKYDIRDLIEVDCVETVAAGEGASVLHDAAAQPAIPAELQGKVYTKREIWDIIVKNAWQTGEPGVVFIDRINESNPTPHVGPHRGDQSVRRAAAAAVRGVQPGQHEPGDVRAERVHGKRRSTGTALRETSARRDALPRQRHRREQLPAAGDRAICRDNRKIGLGVMGFADALFKLGVPYNSDEGVRWGERFMPSSSTTRRTTTARSWPASAAASRTGRAASGTRGTTA